MRTQDAKTRRLRVENLHSPSWLPKINFSSTSKQAKLRTNLVKINRQKLPRKSYKRKKDIQIYIGRDEKRKNEPNYFKLSGKDTMSKNHA